MNAQEEFKKWIESNNGKKLEQALTTPGLLLGGKAATPNATTEPGKTDTGQSDPGKKFANKYQYDYLKEKNAARDNLAPPQLNFNPKDIKKAQFSDPALVNNKDIEKFHTMTKVLPLRGGPVISSSQKKATTGLKPDLYDSLADPAICSADDPKRPKIKNEPYAGHIAGTTLWKYNPNSEYNKLNDKLGNMKHESLQDQRQYYLHRKNLAENIEKARREDPQKAQEKLDADKREKEAEALRAEKRKQYIAQKKLKKYKQIQQQHYDEDDDGSVLLRDGRTRVINFEHTHLEQFSVTSNFVMPDEVVNIMRKYGGVYVKKHKEWTASLHRYKEAAVEIANFCRTRGIEMDLIPDSVFDLIEQKVPFTDPTKTQVVDYDYTVDLENKPTLNQLPKTLLASLYNFQKTGVQYGIDHYGRCLIGDEMGVGKTIQAISISYLFRKDWPILIIAPSSLRFTWRDEIMNWLPFIKEDDIQVITSSQDNFQHTCSIYIVSYNVATRLAGLIDRKGFRIAIVDEAHYLKSRDSKRARNLVPVLMKMKRIMLLSGTPILARPNELYNLLRILRPDIFFSFREFGVRYCNPKDSYFGIDWTGSCNMRELHLAIGNSIMIRRLKIDVLTELPAKRRQRISISTDSNHVKKIHYMLKKVKNWQDKIGRKGENLYGAASLDNDFDQFIQQYGGENGNLMQDATFSSLDDKYSYLVNAYGLTGTAKIKGILEFVETLLENRCKFLIFAHHYDVLDAIEECVIKKKVSHIRIDGKIEVTKRYEAVRKFQTDTECLVAVLSLTASCTGITLTAASTVVFAEMTWTPGIMVQAEDRAHRIGQINAVNVYYLFGENTLDAMIYPRLKLKSEVFANVVDGKATTDFHIEHEDDARKQLKKSLEEKRCNSRQAQKYEKINQALYQQQLANQIQQNGAAAALEKQQTNISDFFFVKQKLTSQSQSTKVSKKRHRLLHVDSATGSTMTQIKEGTMNPEDLSLVDQQYDQFIKGEQNSDEEDESPDSENSNYVEIDKEEELLPFPLPPLFSQSKKRSKSHGSIIDVTRENWEEGCDTKRKAYERLREDKNKMFEENKIWKKYTSVFKGLRRSIPRAKKPNKITEYEVPRDPTKFNKKIDDFDPAMLFELEYAKDEERKRQEEDRIWGPPLTKREIKMDLTEEKVIVKHLPDNDPNERVLSIAEELTQLEYSRDCRPTASQTKQEHFNDMVMPHRSQTRGGEFCTQQPESNPSSMNQSFSIIPRNKKEDLTERTYRERITAYEIERMKKEEVLRKRTDDMLRYMQDIDNHKLRGPSEKDCVKFADQSNFKSWAQNGSISDIVISVIID